MNTILQQRVIAIQGLEIDARMGVLEIERAESQRLLIDLQFASSRQVENLGDDIAQTVDYKAVADRVVEIAAEKPRHLVETLVDDIAEVLTAEFGLAWIELSVRKFILPNAEFISLSVRREMCS